MVAHFHNPQLPKGQSPGAHQECASIRHGPCACIRNRDVVTGAVVAPSCGPTRTEADCGPHVAQTVAGDPTATRGHFVVANLDIPQSEGLVRWVAAPEQPDLDLDLGTTGNRGIRHRGRTRAACLGDPSHRVVCHDPLVHGSWLNQLELWFSILAGTLRKRGSFTSVAHLREQILAVIVADNRTAKPCKWTDQGKPLLG